MENETQKYGKGSKPFFVQGLLLGVEFLVRNMVGNFGIIVFPAADILTVHTLVV